MRTPQGITSTLTSIAAKHFCIWIFTYRSHRIMPFCVTGENPT